MTKSLLVASAAALALTLGTAGKADAQVALSFGRGVGPGFGGFAPGFGGFAPGFGGYSPYGFGVNRGFSFNLNTVPNYGYRSFGNPYSYGGFNRGFSPYNRGFNYGNRGYYNNRRWR